MKPQWNDDVRDIPSLIRAIYECISGPAGAARDWERFRFLHRPEALSLRTVVLSDGSTRSDVFDQDRYISDVEPFFAANDFYEIDIAHRIERFGQVAHAWSLYEARTSPDSPVVLKRGANSIQLCFDQDRWWVVSTIWDNEREGVQFDLW
jgi:hypothetical protein